MKLLLLLATILATLLFGTHVQGDDSEDDGTLQLLVKKTYGRCAYKGRVHPKIAATDMTVHINPCYNFEKTRRCTLHKGRENNITLKFTAREDLVNPKLSVHGHFLRQFHPLDDVQENVCDNIVNYTGGSPCKLVRGETYTFKYNLLLKDAWPNFKTIIMWAFKVGGQTTAKRRTALCAVFPIELKPHP